MSFACIHPSSLKDDQQRISPNVNHIPKLWGLVSNNETYRLLWHPQTIWLQPDVQLPSRVSIHVHSLTLNRRWWRSSLAEIIPGCGWPKRWSDCNYIPKLWAYVPIYPDYGHTLTICRPWLMYAHNLHTFNHIHKLWAHVNHIPKLWAYVNHIPKLWAHVNHISRLWAYVNHT